MANTINNVKLIDEIKATIITEYKEEIETNSEGELRFFVRDATVQKLYPTEELVYKNQRMVPPTKQGMQERATEMAMILIENSLLRFRPIEYGTIVVDYVLNSERTNFDDFRVKVQREVHFPKKK